MHGVSLKRKVWIAPAIAFVAFVAALAVFVVALAYYYRWLVEWSGNDLRSRAEMTAAALSEPLRTLDYKALDAVAARLREKLGNWSRHIETVRGIGYRVKE